MNKTHIHQQSKNSHAWSDDDARQLFQLAKMVTPMEKVLEAFPERTERQIKNKANLMGYSFRDGILRVTL